MSGSRGVEWKLKGENGGIGSKAKVKSNLSQIHPTLGLRV